MKMLLICMLIISLPFVPNVRGQTSGDEGQDQNELNWDNKTLREGCAYRVGLQGPCIAEQPLPSKRSLLIVLSRVISPFFSSMRYLFLKGESDYDLQPRFALPQVEARSAFGFFVLLSTSVAKNIMLA